MDNPLNNFYIWDTYSDKYMRCNLSYERACAVTNIFSGET